MGESQSHPSWKEQHMRRPEPRGQGRQRHSVWLEGMVIEVAGEVTEGVAVDVNMEFSAHILR